MPKLWSATIETHRREVRAAVIEAASRLVAEQGLRGATMSRIAERAGIGRATLYKYYPDPESILRDWHAEQVARHLAQLTVIGQRAGAADRRLREVLRTHAELARESASHGDAGGASDIVAALHADERVTAAGTTLEALVTGLIDRGVRSEQFRRDIPSDELALFSLGAMEGARRLTSAAALDRRLDLVLQALRG